MNVQQLITHGKYGTPVYVTWWSMKQRCLNPKRKDYVRYGGRGIGVCKGWLKFEAFYRDLGDRPNGMTLERPDNARGYACGTCEECCGAGISRNGQWADRFTQNRNKRSNRLLTHNGQTRTLYEWARLLGINPLTLHERLKKWSFSDAVGKTKVTDRRGLRVPLGSAHGQAKLKEADIPEIRKLLTALSQAEVANLYSVSRSTIEGIHRGVTWKSVA